MQVDGGGRQDNQGVLNLRHYFQVLWKRKWLILAIIGVTVGSAWAQHGGSCREERRWRGELRGLRSRRRLQPV